MKSFVDSCERSWLAIVNCNTLRRVQAMTGVNLGDVRNIGDLSDRLRADDLFVGEVALALCSDQIEKADVKPADFLGSMRGDSIGSAADAISDGLAGFFRSPETRSAVARLLSLSRQAHAAVLASINSTSGATATSSPASSASTPETSPSAS